MYKSPVTTFDPSTTTLAASGFVQTGSAFSVSGGQLVRASSGDFTNTLYSSATGLNSYMRLAFVWSESIYGVFVKLRYNPASGNLLFGTGGIKYSVLRSGNPGIQIADGDGTILNTNAIPLGQIGGTRSEGDVLQCEAWAITLPGINRTLARWLVTNLTTGIVIGDIRAVVTTASSQSAGACAVSVHMVNAAATTFAGKVVFGASLPKYTATSGGGSSLTSELVSVGPATITATATPASITAPAYQWYASLAAGYTAGSGTAISGATSATLSYTPPTDGTYNIKCVCTGSNVTVTSAEIAVRRLPEVSLEWIGDSRIGQVAGDYKLPYLVQQRLDAAVPAFLSYNDIAISGTTAQLPTNGNGGYGTWDPADNTAYGWYNVYVPNFAARGITHVVMQLGVNDSAVIVAGNGTLANYIAKMTAIVTGLVAQGCKVLVLRVWPVNPEAAAGGGAWSEGIVRQQNAGLDALSTIAGVTVGKYRSYNALQNDWSTYIDGVHPAGNAGNTAWAEVVAIEVADWLLGYGVMPAKADVRANKDIGDGSVGTLAVGANSYPAGNSFSTSGALTTIAAAQAGLDVIPTQAGATAFFNLIAPAGNTGSVAFTIYGYVSSGSSAIPLMTTDSAIGAPLKKVLQPGGGWKTFEVAGNYYKYTVSANVVTGAGVLQQRTVII